MVKRLFYAPSSIVTVPNVFGNGSGGNVTLTSNTVLSEDLNCNTLIINSGVTLYPSGYRICAKRAIYNRGIIDADGGAGIGGNIGSGIQDGYWGWSANGGVGGSGAAAGVQGQAADVFIALNNASDPGKGGNAGGNNGAFCSYSNQFDVPSSFFNNVVQASVPQVQFNGSLYPIWGGRGGGGGAGGGVGAQGGGGGGGGGLVLIAAPLIDNSAGTIRARGGAGGNGSGSGNAGGGGGGSGGTIILLGLTIVQGTITVAGGAGGSGLGTGVAGATGDIGNIILVNGVSR